MVVVPMGQGESLDEMLGGYEERIARLERREIDRELVVNTIKIIIDEAKVYEELTISTVAFCTWTAGREEWGPTSTGYRVNFLQACDEDWT